MFHLNPATLKFALSLAVGPQQLATAELGEVVTLEAPPPSNQVSIDPSAVESSKKGSKKEKKVHPTCPSWPFGSVI
jgi:hypothetical protein